MLIMPELQSSGVVTIVVPIAMLKARLSVVFVAVEETINVRIFNFFVYCSSFDFLNETERRTDEYFVVKSDEEATRADVFDDWEWREFDDALLIVGSWNLPVSLVSQSRFRSLQYSAWISKKSWTFCSFEIVGKLRRHAER